LTTRTRARYILHRYSEVYIGHTNRVVSPIAQPRGKGVAPFLWTKTKAHNQDHHHRRHETLVSPDPLLHRTIETHTDLETPRARCHRACPPQSFPCAPRWRATFFSSFSSSRPTLQLTLELSRVHTMQRYKVVAPNPSPPINRLPLLSPHQPLLFPSLGSIRRPKNLIGRSTCVTTKLSNQNNQSRSEPIRARPV
jgi:hypothetical protein